MTHRRLTLPEANGVAARPAAAVVLLRDGDRGCETLLVLRNPQLTFHGGAWVFPGGRIDDSDFAAARDPHDPMSAARVAAVREAHEEASVRVAADELVPVSRWVTPEGLPKRFDAWYFAAPASADPVCVDGGEIFDHRWIRPSDALAAHRAGELELPPPTWVTLHALSDLPTAAAALESIQQLPFESFLPRLHMLNTGACALYEGDSAYDTGNLDGPGPRHRLWMIERSWRYERDRR